MSTEELLKTLRKEYIESIPEKIKEIENYMESQNFPGLLNAFHKLKGSGSTYGFEEISQMGHKVETAIKNNESNVLNQISEAVESLKSFYQGKK